MGTPHHSGREGTILHTDAIELTKDTPVNWLKKLLNRRHPSPTPEQHAKNLIAAIDGGGLPLNAARVNDIARALGLEVSTRARMDDTIRRIREALERVEDRR